jgi:hypothetical protein
VGSVHLDDDFVDPENLNDLFEFILLSECNDTMSGSALADERGYVCSKKWDLYWIMLLKWDESGTVAERRGLGQVYQDAITTAFEPGPFWKEIILA